MLRLFQQIDKWLLPRDLNEKFSPYVWLIYLPLFFVPVIIFYQDPMDLVWTAFALIAFLALYFHSFWVDSQYTIYHIVGIIFVGTLATLVTSNACTLFIYAGAFCGRLKPIKYAFLILIALLMWIIAISWVFDFDVYFYFPALVFSTIVGVSNIYQYALDKNKQDLILSRKETQRLAKIAERERIARDLHDLIGHTFSVLTLKADLAGRLLDKDIDKARAEIKDLEDISRDALSQVREVVSGYRSSDLLTELANAKHVFAGVDIAFHHQFENIDENELELHSTDNKELAIVLRELVTNVIKHAKATQVNVTIKRENKSIILTLQDNGQGFEKSQYQGFGIKGINERIQKLNGVVSINSGKEFKGTLTEISLPVLARES